MTTAIGVDSGSIITTMRPRCFFVPACSRNAHRYHRQNLTQDSPNTLHIALRYNGAQDIAPLSGISRKGVDSTMT
jgi:hypothetical protein